VIQLPRFALVVLVGPSGCGKSTFARRHFGAFETVSSDVCRALVAGDPGDQTATAAAFDVLHLIVARRLERRLLTVVDATSVTAESRAPLLAIARQHQVPAIAVVFDVPEELCLRNDAARPDRHVPAEAIRLHRERLARSLPGIHTEGFTAVHLLRGVEAIDAVTVDRTSPLATTLRGGGAGTGSLPGPPGSVDVPVRGGAAGSLSDPGPMPGGT